MGILKMEEAFCCICKKNDNAVLLGSGYDYEYNSSGQEFFAYQCNDCGVVFINPRPAMIEAPVIYPPNYHAYDFSAEKFGFVHKVRSRLEANRLLKLCKGLPGNAKILDMGCGDGFHLKLLQQYGNKHWSLAGVDIDKKAIEMARRAGLTIHEGTIESVDLPAESVDMVLMIMTIEHVSNPDGVLAAVFRVLKPGGRVVVVTDNTDSLDFSLFKKKYWGGYHFPRHWNLFNKKSFEKLATQQGYSVRAIRTLVSPVNWVYSLHNWLKGNKAPQWLTGFFTLQSTISLGIFTLLDIPLQLFGRGAILQIILYKPVKK